MSQRKPWSLEEDQLLRDLLQDSEGSINQKLKWVEIAEKLAQIGTTRTGKQCRQRWHNQLKPGIENQREWSLVEQQTLFRVQQQLGNHWAQIAKELPGRTDNNIKNYFYSTLRKAMRKVNSYVLQHRKEGPYRNVKQFKQFTLNKILAVAEHKYENKINLRSSGVEYDAREIKKLLVDLQRDENIIPTSEKHPLFENTIQRILEFNRNCKRRKGKRKDTEDDKDSEEMIQTPLYNTKILIEQNPEKMKKQEKPKMPKEFIAILQQEQPQKKTDQNKKQESQIAVSQYILNSGFVGRSNSSYQKESQILLSSSFREYQGGVIDHNPLAESHNYAGNCEKGGFLSSIPNFEKKQTNRSEVGLEFWREDPFQGHPLTFMMDWSGNIGNMFDDAQMRLSMSLGASAFLQHKTPNQIDRQEKEPTTK